MFCARYFAPRQFAPRYFPKVGLDGGGGTPVAVFLYHLRMQGIA